VQLGIAPNRIDLLTSIDGVTFEDAWAGRATGQCGAEPVAFLGRAEFLRNKRVVQGLCSAMGHHETDAMASHAGIA
jgi:hypothetical protein